MASSVVSAVVLGLFTLYVAGSLKDKPQALQVPSAGQVDSLAAGSAVDEKPVNPVVKRKTESTVSLKKTEKPPVETAVKAASAVIREKAPAAPAATPSAYEPESGVETLAKEAGKAPAGEQDYPDRADKLAHELYLAGNYERAGDHASAIESYRKALQLDPGNYKAMNNIASIFLKAGSTAEAVPYLKDSLRVQDSYVPAIVNMGIAFAREGSLADAEAHFRKALAIEPSSELALLNMAVLCENDGRKELAREYYGRLRSFGHPQGAAGLDRLR